MADGKFVRFSEELVIDANGIVPDSKAKAPPDPQQVERARKFLALFCRKTAAVSTQRSSYGLKHTAEKLEGYISNGALIQAAKELGYKMRPMSPRSPNVHLNIALSKGVEHYIRSPKDYRPRSSRRVFGGQIRRRFFSEAEEAEFVKCLPIIEATAKARREALKLA